MQASRGNRLGEVFSVRVSPEQRVKLEAMQAAGGGPRSLGAWLLWSALDRAGITTAAVLPPARYYQSGLPGVDEVLPAQPGAGITPPRHERLILDLCAGSGSWSQPYVDAGYRVQVVTLPERDVRVLPAPPEPVWGILAAPPCDQFSIARNGVVESPRDFVRGMACVNACMRIVLQCKLAWPGYLKWWGLENPGSGLLAGWLGAPRDAWQPCDFGDPWTKHTSIWGEYTVPARGPYVEPLGGGPICTVCDPAKRERTWCANAAHRAVTPQGFARAFFEANQ